MIRVMVEKEQTIPEFVEKAVEASKSDGVILDTRLVSPVVSDLQNELAKVNLQISKLEDKKIHITPLHDYCNCIHISYYDSNKHVCKYHQARKTLGPQYWVEQDFILFDIDHPHNSHLVLPSRTSWRITAPNTNEALAYLMSMYGPGNEKEKQLQHQYRLNKLYYVVV